MMDARSFVCGRCLRVGDVAVDLVCVREAMRPSVGLDPHDTPAERRPSVVRGGLRADTQRVRPWGVGGQLGVEPLPLLVCGGGGG